MKNYKIHLLRTGATSESPGKRYVGQQDIPLCDKGRDALEQLREEYLYPPAELVFTSPLRRCIETADILYPGGELVAVEDLRDMHMGEFEGKTFEELRTTPAFSAWLANSFENPPPGGEDSSAFTRRIVQGLNQMLRLMMDQGVHNAAAITHGGVIMTLLAAVGMPKLPLHQWATANGTGFTILLSAQMWMRDGAAEVLGFIPNSPLGDDMELYGE